MSISMDIAGAEEHSQSTDGIYAINLAKTVFREGFAKGNVEQILSIYDESFTDMSFGMPSFYDTDAKQVLRARLERLFKDFTATMKVSVIKVVLNQNEAVDRGWHILDLRSRKDGRSIQVRTRYFERWRHDAARGWVITSFIDNLDQSPRLASELINEIEASDDEYFSTRLPRDLPEVGTSELT